MDLITTPTLKYLLDRANVEDGPQHDVVGLWLHFLRHPQYFGGEQFIFGPNYPPADRHQGSTIDLSISTMRNHKLNIIIVIDCKSTGSTESEHEAAKRTTYTACMAIARDSGSEEHVVYGICVSGTQMTVFKHVTPMAGYTERKEWLDLEDPDNGVEIDGYLKDIARELGT